MRVAALMSRERIATIGVTLESSYELTGYDNISDLLAAMQQAPHGAVLIEAGLITATGLRTESQPLSADIPCANFRRSGGYGPPVLSY